MSHRIHIGLFEDEHLLLAAAQECRQRKIPVADVVSPYPVHGLDDVLGIRRSRLPWVTLIGGIIGGCLGLWFQYWSTGVSWPLNIGGKPFDSLPAFMPVAFEITILIAGLSTAFFLLYRSKVYPGRKVPEGLERTTDDQLALILEQQDASLIEEDYRDLFKRHGAVDILESYSEA